ncbi:GMC family oxidoreductase [Alsobacter sp. SYSU M60028]|uniref:GMC family oxidoreductase n=1 Tax=Alsobacter ponti TaxID=2962936 RepID=A0ABT1L9Y5_9HYPH|nr:GMC family oxidoreductase [Alsobacter ponti]MCP8938259.1 GMC family oxidoreductase [Alsobacter ponti]
MGEGRPSPDIDILIVGSGIGGATLAAGLAGSGARVLILERGEQLPESPTARDTRAIFLDGVYRPREQWLDAAGEVFNPGNYYYLGGNSKFYGAVMLRYREKDFTPLAHAEGETPGWPIPYSELEPWYGRAERLFQVRGATGEDPTEPPRSSPYPFGPVPDEPPIARARERLKAAGLRPFSLPLAVDIDRWLAHGATPWDAYPDTRSGKFDAETASLATALADPNISVQTRTRAVRLLASPDGRIEGVEAERDGERRVIRAGLVVLAAGAVNSAALLLASADEAHPHGIANRSGVVGRHFMNHNCTAMLVVDPRQRNDSVYQKTLAINDFYFDDGRGGPPLGNVQLLGKITAPILKANLRGVPTPLLAPLAARTFDWYLMSEDLPHPDSRVRLDGGRIVLDWRRSNMLGHARLVETMRERFRAAGYPIVLSRAFDRRTPSHQCGTIRFGTDPASSALDVWCRAHDHPNLYVVDASFLPTSAAVNPALTIAAQALRVADRIRREHKLAAAMTESLA